MPTAHVTIRQSQRHGERQPTANPLAAKVQVRRNTTPMHSLGRNIFSIRKFTYKFFPFVPFDYTALFQTWRTTEKRQFFIQEKKNEITIPTTTLQLEIQECGCCDAKFIGIKLIKSEKTTTTTTESQTGETMRYHETIFPRQLYSSRRVIHRFAGAEFACSENRKRERERERRRNWENKSKLCSRQVNM